MTYGYIFIIMYYDSYNYIFIIIMHYIIIFVHIKSGPRKTWRKNAGAQFAVGLGGGGRGSGVTCPMTPPTCPHGLPLSRHRPRWLLARGSASLVKDKVFTGSDSRASQSPPSPHLNQTQCPTTGDPAHNCLLHPPGKRPSPPQPARCF
jgi:hypothetical protein